MRSSAFASSLRRSILAASIVLTCVAPAAANPFMGSGTALEGPSGSSRSISSVRASAASPALVSRQASLRDTLGGAFYAWKATASRSSLWAILVAAFAYGALHALGPGHRKAVVFSLYLARRAPPWEPAGVGALLALLHAGAAVVILLCLRGVSGAISGRADSIGLFMEGFAYLALVAVALFLVARAALDLARKVPRAQGDAGGLGTVLLTGIYPCPGAILVLVLSLSLDLVGIGILAVFVMSLGMTIPIIAAGYLAWFGRTGLFLALKSRESVFSRVATALSLIGYSFLLAFASYMVAPFARGLIAAAQTATLMRWHW